MEERLATFLRKNLRKAGLDLPATFDLVEPLRIQPLLRVRTERAVMDGACLIGDAAGTVNPLTGTGMTMAANDAIHLAEILSAERGRGLVPASQLEPFETRRDAIRRSLEERSDLRVRLVLETGEPELVEAYWRLYSGKDAVPRHPDLVAILERLTALQETLGVEYARGKEGGLLASG
jgi:2-polyprenyl-6-methoxyphenol hydroxylase-like FAD-dependent oxidoreductase